MVLETGKTDPRFEVASVSGWDCTVPKRASLHCGHTAVSRPVAR